MFSEFFIKLCLLILPLSACGNGGYTQVDDLLKPEIEAWRVNCEQFLPKHRCDTGKIDSIQLVSEIEGKAIGRCIIRHEWEGVRYVQTREIFIKDSIKLGSYEMKAVILHELFHCQYDVKHTGSGLMRPHSFEEGFLEKNWPKLLSDAYRIVK